MEENNHQNTLRFVLGEETRPKVEFLKNARSLIRIEDSIFFKQYSLAISSIAELVAYNKILKNKNVQNEHSVHNNIIVFNGDRGSGKTSCMLSVKELLCDNSLKNEILPKLEISANRDILAETNFFSMGIIDPIFFDERHNILELFIGTLFKNFKNEEKNRRNSGKPVMEYEERNNLLQSFSKAKENLSLLNTNINLSEDDNLEQLNDLVASMNVKDSLWRLVKDYINTMYQSKNSQLVLCIDDIDLNMSEGYQMIDQIRKYLNIPGLVILLAIKIDQLANVIRIKYSTDYEPLMEQKYENNEDKKKYEEIINQIVERYIAKLFPLSQRISMPDVGDLLSWKTELLQENGEKVYELPTLKNDILKLIYSRTRMLFYNSSRQVNFIIPLNLRDLLNFLHFLYNMKEAKTHTEAIPNIVHFKIYFYGTWCTNNLDENDLAFMRATQSFLTAININSYIINFLKERFPVLAELENKEGYKDSHIRELAYILHKENMMFNLSLGDVMACLDWLNKVCHKDRDLKLLFAIKTFYSMALYENFRYKNEIQEENKKLEKEIINKQTLTNNETNYGDIVNGNFFNSEYLNVAPYDKGGMSRCRRVIDNKLLMDLLEYVKNPDKISDKLKELKVEEVDKEKLQKIVEFFILTTSFVFEAKDKEKGEILPKYRRKNEVYYEKNVLNNRMYICFDILSVFYNLLYVDKAYKRFNISADKDKLLYDDILNKINKDNKEEHLHYKLNIRNVEILEQISYLLQRERPDSAKDSVVLYQNMFETLSTKYKIRTYDNMNIDYGFFGGIAEFLGGLNVVEKEIFESIYFDRDTSSKDVSDSANETKKQNG